MNYQLPADLEQLVAEQIRLGPYRSADDVLRALAERNQDLAAIRGGVEDMEGGRLRPLAEVDVEIRNRLGFVSTNPRRKREEAS